MIMKLSLWTGTKRLSINVSSIAKFQAWGDQGLVRGFFYKFTHDLTSFLLFVNKHNNKLLKITIFWNSMSFIGTYLQIIYKAS